MRGLEAALSAAAEVQGVLGAILCDGEGEAVLTRVGPSPLSPPMEREARSHVPDSLHSEEALVDFLLRLAGAEPSALLASLRARTVAGGGGELEGLEIGFRAVRVVVVELGKEYYLVTVLDRASARGFAEARRMAERVRPALKNALG